MLEGELTFQLGDELVPARPGDCAFAPRNGHHTLANLGGETVAYVLTCTPAGFERYFDRLQADSRDDRPRAADWRTPERVRRQPMLAVPGPHAPERA